MSWAENVLGLQNISCFLWQLTLFFLHKGICVADVHEMIVMKNFFIDLKIPYSAVRNEQIEIKAIIHNFYSRKVKVRLEEWFTMANLIRQALGIMKEYALAISRPPFFLRSMSFSFLVLGPCWTEGNQGHLQPGQ